mmetsp:Transcript_20780/g.68665  ORF Transcript_20780/g.68665 Transcript_20780/m.68665 type:complete len:417 (+) Transcript_20780:752-2002(+)
MKGERAHLACVKEVPLLKTLDSRKLTALVKSLELIKFKDGAKIIRQGDEGDAFYIIESGSVTCTRVNTRGEQEELATLTSPDCFGEMALMDNSPRHATVIAKGEVHCLTLDRAHFVKLLGPLKSILQAHSCLHVLRSIELFSELTDAELDSIVNAMHSEKFVRSTPIIKEGKKGTTFYVLQTGTAEVSRDGVSIGQLQSGDYFGERALIDGAPRSASVYATDDVVCYTLERKKFESLLINTAGTAGKFEEEMRRRQKITRSKCSGSGALIGTESEPLLAELKVCRLLGQGTFGRVKLVEHPQTGGVSLINSEFGANMTGFEKLKNRYTLKCMSKVQVVKQQQEKNVIAERDLLYECASTFVLKLHTSYQSPDELFLLMELIQGGELWQYIYEKKHLITRSALGGLTTNAAQFYAAG